MKVRINNFHPNYLNVRITTNSYRRHKHYSKINFLKYADLKFMTYIPYELYKKTRDNKWVLVNPANYRNPFTNQLLMGKILQDSLIRNPFTPLKYLNRKPVNINKYLRLAQGYFILVVVLVIFFIIFQIIFF